MLNQMAYLWSSLIDRKQEEVQTEAGAGNTKLNGNHTRRNAGTVGVPPACEQVSEGSEEHTAYDSPNLYSHQVAGGEVDRHAPLLHQIGSTPVYAAAQYHLQSAEARDYQSHKLTCSQV